MAAEALALAVVELVDTLEWVVMVVQMILVLLFKELLVKVAVAVVDMLYKISVNLHQEHLIPHMVVEEV